MGNRRDYITNELVRICGLLDSKCFVANHDGNISVRFEDGLLATPTAEHKGVITPEMIIRLDSDGKKIEGIGNPFSEIKLHLAAYRARPEAKAVVHAHPPITTAKGLAGSSLEVMLPEAIISIGKNIPVTNMTMPGTPESEQEVEKAFGLADVVMMPGNGVLAIGDNLEQAYLRLELAEHVAKIEYYGKAFGDPIALSEKNMTKLLEKRKSLGLGPQTKTENVVVPDNSEQDIRRIIMEELKKVIGN